MKLQILIGLLPQVDGQAGGRHLGKRKLPTIGQYYFVG